MNYNIFFMLTIFVNACATDQNNNEKFFGNITKQQAKDFLFGAALGASNGAVNKIIKSESPATIKSAASAPNDEYHEAFTFACATIVHGAYDNKKINTASILGRAIGQVVAESVIPDKQTGKTQFELNTSLVAMVGYFFYQAYKTVKNNESNNAPKTE